MKQVWFALSLVALSVVVWSKVSGQIMEQPELDSALKKKKKKKKNKLKKKNSLKMDFPVLSHSKQIRPVAGVDKTEVRDAGKNKEEAL